MGKTYRELSKELYHAKMDIESYERDRKVLKEKFENFKKTLKNLEEVIFDTTDDLTDYQKEMRIRCIKNTFKDLIEGANETTWDTFTRHGYDTVGYSSKHYYRVFNRVPAKPMSDHDAHCLAMDICEEMGWDYDLIVGGNPLRFSFKIYGPVFFQFQLPK